MRLNQLETKDGIYCALKPSLESKLKIQSLIKQFNIENPILPDDLHATLIYSRINIKIPKPTIPITVEVIGTDLFGENKNTLVLLLKSNEMHEYFNICKDLGCTSSFPNYHPHLSLSYDCTKKIKLNEPLKIVFDDFYFDVANPNEFINEVELISIAESMVKRNKIFFDEKNIPIFTWNFGNVIGPDNYPINNGDLFMFNGKKVKRYF